VVVRASDEERERVVALLRRHYAAGRLTAEELEERTERAWRAVWRADLSALLRDLPSEWFARHVAPRLLRAQRAAMRIHVALYASVNGALVGTWALTGQGEFWPAWTLVPWTALLGWHAAGSYALSRALPEAPRRRPRRMA
jgi:hypothetical protein